MKGKIHTRLFALALTALFCGVPVFGSGFALYEGSSRGVALGGFAGRADDAAALFYNPAGITQLSGSNYMFGATVIIPRTDFSTTNLYDGVVESGKNEANSFTPPHFYYTRQLNDRMWFGFGVMSRFGLGSEFDENWSGRYNSHNANIQSLSFNPNLAWRLGDRFSFALGLSAMWIDVELSQKIDGNLFLGLPHNNPSTTDLDVNQTIAGDNIGYGFNLAAHYILNDQWTFGASYNSRVSQDVEGKATFQRPSDPRIPEIWFQDTNGSASLDLPEMLFLGASYKVNQRWQIELGATYTDWSSYQHLRLSYDDPIVIQPGFGIILTNVVKLKNWENVWRYNVGAEWKFRDNIDLLFGYIYDESPIPDETIDYLLPTSDRTLWNVGARYRMGDWVLDGSYSYLTLKDRSVSERQLADGVLDTRLSGSLAHLISFSVSYAF